MSERGDVAFSIEQWMSVENLYNLSDTCGERQGGAL